MRNQDEQPIFFFFCLVLVVTLLVLFVLRTRGF